MVLVRGRFVPEFGVNPEFIHLVNRDDEVVTKHLAVSLIIAASVLLRSESTDLRPVSHFNECVWGVRTVALYRPSLFSSHTSVTTVTDTESAQCDNLY